MSDVTNIHSYGRSDALSGAARSVSPGTSRDAVEGGKVLPPSSSSQPVVELQGSAQDQTALAEDLSEAVSQMNDYLQASQRDLRFSIDEELGETIVKVLDRETQEVIRQIPNEVFLDIARSLQPDEPMNFLSEQASWTPLVVIERGLTAPFLHL